MNYEDYFEKTNISDTSISYRWNLNKVPKGCDQIVLLAKLIQRFRDEDKDVRLRPDKRKRAKGLIVVFINEKPPLQ